MTIRKSTWLPAEVGLHAAPVVAEEHGDHRRGPQVGRRAGRAIATSRATSAGFDVRTGKRLWIFHTIPRPGEFGIDTWENDRGRTPATLACGDRFRWTNSSGLPICRWSYRPETISVAHRPGNGLFGESLVAVDLKTGKRKWHYQLVHHGLWDMDIPCAPILTESSW